MATGPTWTSATSCIMIKYLKNTSIISFLLTFGDHTKASNFSPLPPSRREPELIAHFWTTLFVQRAMRLKVTAHFTSIARVCMCWGACGGGGTLVTWITSPSARLPVKIPFSHTVMVQCAELGDISGPFHSGGGECRHAYASLLETIISARSIVHPTAWLAECTASIAGRGARWWGGCMRGQLQQGRSEQLRWMIACCVRHSSLLTCKEMQFVRRTGGRMLSSGRRCSCRQHTDGSRRTGLTLGHSGYLILFPPASQIDSHTLAPR